MSRLHGLITLVSLCADMRKNCNETMNGPQIRSNNTASLVGNLTDKIEIDPNVVLSLPDQEARVLEAPLHIRNDELPLRCCLRAIDVDLHRNRQVVRSAEESEHSVHLNGRVA